MTKVKFISANGQRPGDGTVNSYDEWSVRLELVAKALGENMLKRLHIHLSGIEYGSKGEKNHLPIAESDFKLADLFRALHTFNAGGRILCESPVMEADALYMKNVWQEISGEQI